ncbi:nickel-dependent hydrogenase large subunit [Corynebacterium sp. 153RC1]|uniref:nickel-dependent hydrogenase large subunit n=1 Tax=unclassified Corynebacterium TaxID=2624378 RepID=UPI00211BBCAB|nr:nickel-dependent hydrogenase large subunit [Corynebacterium sp. 209RC1]MCQ9354830.1 nickel-dependent hydrogenase large subunit [Corynebacterium sp. 1222RC1]MCQ9357015.1 nickel-dependent hydrogenase large subunit [Corynebacterium sp. 122RC1]MCQ9359098.1 nickel-dependent hydrogenase large subunit [Corynebacterium sp. 142RC1]MCQ9361483.1 nickel-dependent hydrogenase large subunit [Corynebacterium sp. 153RC1]MCQ9363608.1 nickel-dependent hydrogenase large subunit [Corynebacterium sp. 732RC1]MC
MNANTTPEASHTRRATISIGQVVDPLAAKVIISTSPPAGLSQMYPSKEDWERDPFGIAHFDLHGVPRVEDFLVGKPAREVPALVTRLCGLCPVTHHLAGIAALDQLVSEQPSEPALKVRALLHYGSVLDVLGPRVIASQGRQAQIAVKSIGKNALALAGAMGHFPDVAIPGGVRIPAGWQNGQSSETATTQRHAILDALDAAAELLDAAYSAVNSAEANANNSHHRKWKLPPFPGAAVRLADANPLGQEVEVTLGEATQRYSAAEFAANLIETIPGAIAPRPMLRLHGQWVPFKVGPTARFPEELGAAAAQVALVREALGRVGTLVEEFPHVVAQLGQEPAREVGDGIGVGLVDGPRGLLMHQYEVEGGVLRKCQILSPTAQNEPWLAYMLGAAFVQYAGEEGGQERMKYAMEQAVRAADPCLPCTQAPEGMMNIEVEYEPFKGKG